MIVTLIGIFVRLVLLAGVAALLLSTAGDSARALVPERFHFAAWITGMVLFCMSMLAAAEMRKPAENQRRWIRMWTTGACVGALLFVLFMAQMECFFARSALGGGVQCRYLGDN